MKKILNLTAFLGLLVAIWSCGENDGSVFTDGQTFLLGLAGLGMTALGLVKGGVK